MTAVKNLPTMSELRRLARQVNDYPISGLGITQYAEHLGYSREAIGLVKRFSRTMVFKNRLEFLSYCSLLLGILKEERASSPERSRSPQD